MASTPPLPDWVRNAEVAGYATAHRLCPEETRLFGTESLYGDWNGRVLLLAKDLGPSRILHHRIASGDTRPYRHEPGMRTNRQLQPERALSPGTGGRKAAGPRCFLVGGPYAADTPSCR